MSQYARRNTEDLGDLYLRHVNAMTEEGLHSKSDIAAELAWRDERIADLLACVRQTIAYLSHKPDCGCAMCAPARAAISKATGDNQ